MGTQTQDAAAWEQEMEEVRKRDRTEEDAIKDAQSAELMKEQERIEEETALKDLEEELRQLDMKLAGGLIRPEAHAQRSSAAQKKMNEYMEWSRKVGVDLMAGLKIKFRKP